MKRIKRWKYILICNDEYSDKSYSRAFENPEDAANYVDRLHGRLWDRKTDKFKAGVGFEVAELFKIEANGRLVVYDIYETYRRPDSVFARCWFGNMKRFQNESIEDS